MPPSFQDTLQFLSQAAVWPDPTDTVRMLDTHQSVVFLTDRHAYKIKKPVRRPSVDLTSAQARRANALAEVHLNRRLAPLVYLGLVVLMQSEESLFLHDPTGHPGQRTKPAGARTGPGTEVVDWLVNMVRLPAATMLDQIIRAGALHQTDITQIAQVLSGFYRRTPRIALPADFYLARQSDGLRTLCEALHATVYGLDGALIDEISSAQRYFLRVHGSQLAERAAGGHIVEGHGDLRPEHVCLAAAPVFIDCLEFDRRLRIADPADELAGLAVECAFLGAPQVQAWLFEAYRQASGDDVNEVVVRYYGVQRALARARLAAWHLDDPISDALRDHWRTRATAFLHMALERTSAKV